MHEAHDPDHRRRARVLTLVTVAAHALTFPPLTGRVVDEASILDAATRQTITDKLAAVEAKSGDQIVVVTLNSLQGTSIEDYGYQLGRQWGIGEKDRNNGALLIVAPNERKVRIEVGYGLEGALTDAVTRLIIQNAILPRFRANDFAGGITRGVDDIVQVVSGDAEEYKRRAAQRPDKAPQGWSAANFIFVLLRAGRDLHDACAMRRRPARASAGAAAARRRRSSFRPADHGRPARPAVGRRRILGRRRLVRRRRFVGELVMILSDADRARIVEAIRDAELRTSGEIYCVVTRGL